jgi:hypothetical protein
MAQSRLLPRFDQNFSLYDSVSAEIGGGPMRRIVLAIVGALLIIAGVVWTLQGLGYIKGSVMTGVTLWALIGPVIAAGGLAMTVTGLRSR